MKLKWEWVLRLRLRLSQTHFHSNFTNIKNCFRNARLKIEEIEIEESNGSLQCVICNQIYDENSDSIIGLVASAQSTSGKFSTRRLDVSRPFFAFSIKHGPYLVRKL